MSEKNVLSIVLFLLLVSCRKSESSVDLRVNGSNLEVIAGEVYYVQDEKIDYKPLDKHLLEGYLTNNSSGEFNFVRSRKDIKNSTSAAVSVYLEDGTPVVSINNLYYKTSLEKGVPFDLAKAFVSSSLPELGLNPNNYEEFISSDGTIYEKGSEILESDINHFLAPVKLNGEKVNSLTFDSETGEILSASDKLFMTNPNVTTIAYEGLYLTKTDNLSVKIGEVYFELVEK